jgi:tripartite-type tricarboxylate transporter receptor subunit TctC
MMSMRNALLAGVLSAALHTAPALADEPYRGKTVDMVISSGAGGGYDLYGRLVARYMPHHIPGNPTFVVQNMTGAGGLAAMNYVANVARPDGLTIGQIQNTVPFQKLFGVAGSAFDPTAVAYLGSANSEVAVAFTWHASPTQSFEDLLKRETVMAGSTGAISAIDARAMNDLLGTKIKLVTGYPGTTESYLAIQRGEAEGFPATFWSSLKAGQKDWLAQKKIKIIVQLALAKAPDLPDPPLIFDFVRTPEQRSVFELLLTPQALGRPFVVAPATPPDRVALLRTAFEQTMKDPDFLAEAKRLNLDVELTSGQHVESLVRKAYQSPPALVARVESIMGGAH